MAPEILLLILSFGAACYFFGVSRVQKQTITRLDESEQTFFDFYVDRANEDNRERKLWTNEARVRTGTGKIFSEIETNPVELVDFAPRKEESAPLNFEMKPPFAGKRQEWKGQHKDMQFSAPVKQQEPKIEEDLTQIANEQ